MFLSKKKKKKRDKKKRQMTIHIVLLYDKYHVVQTFLLYKNRHIGAHVTQEFNSRDDRE
jgi:hypothetical protein